MKQPSDAAGRQNDIFSSVLAAFLAGMDASTASNLIDALSHDAAFDAPSEAGAHEIATAEGTLLDATIGLAQPAHT